MSFPKAKLGSLTAKIGSGITPRGGDSVYVSQGTALIRSQNVYNAEFIASGLVYVDDPIAEKMAGVTVQEDDVLLNITGDSVARCCLASKKHLPARVNQHVSIIRTDKRVLNSSFLMYYLVSPYMQKMMLSLAGSGGTRKALTKGMITDFEVSKPDIDVQKRVVAILSTYDDLIENNRRRIQLLEESARLLYREWFVDLRFPGHEHVKVVDGVPEGWSVETLGTKARITMGQSPKSEFYNNTGEGLPFHQGVTNYGDRFVSHKTYSTKTTRIADVGDILCSVRAPVGRLNYTCDEIILGRGLCGIASLTSNQSFLYYQLNDFFFKEDIIGSGAIYAAVTKKDMHNIKLISPPVMLVKQFEKKSTSIDLQILNLSEQNQKLIQARDLLLPRLMSGEIEL